MAFAKKVMVLLDPEQYHGPGKEAGRLGGHLRSGEGGGGFRKSCE